MEEFWFPDEECWRCRKHPSPPRTGVCPVCLRDRLLRLCSACARVRPCGCSASLSCSSSTTTNSSSSISFSQESAVFGSEREGGVGAVGRVSELIGNEPAFRRSRSNVFHRILQRSDDVREGKVISKGLLWMWPFWKEKRREEEDKTEARETLTVVEEEKRAAEVAGAVRLYRSRSVGATGPVLATFSHSSSTGVPHAVGIEEKGKGWNWYFPSPMKAFGHRSKAARVVRQTSPLYRG